MTWQRDNGGWKEYSQEVDAVWGACRQVKMEELQAPMIADTLAELRDHGRSCCGRAGMVGVWDTALRRLEGLACDGDLAINLMAPTTHGRWCGGAG